MQCNVAQWCAMHVCMYVCFTLAGWPHITCKSGSQPAARDYESIKFDIWVLDLKSDWGWLGKREKCFSVIVHSQDDLGIPKKKSQPNPKPLHQIRCGTSLYELWLSNVPSRPGTRPLKLCSSWGSSPRSLALLPDVPGPTPSHRHERSRPPGRCSAPKASAGWKANRSWKVRSHRAPRPCSGLQSLTWQLKILWLIW